jgi:hypothetical protein
MEISKLFKVVKEITDKVQATNLNGHIQTINQNIDQLIRQAQGTPVAKQRFLTQVENGKKEILTAINTYIPTSLSVEESKVYESLGAYNLFGYEGQQQINKIFVEIQTNPNVVKGKLQQYLQEINKIIQLHGSIASFSDKLPLSGSQKDNLDSIVIFFQGGSEINNLDELAKVSTKWNQVLIAFAQLARESDRTFRIEAVERGSIILTLSAIAGIVYAFGKASDKVLDTVKKYYEIKKLAHEAKQLKGGVPEKTIKDLEEASKLKIVTETKEITKELIEEFNWNENGDKEAVDNAVRMAIRHLLEFVNKGGKVDIKLIAQDTQNKQMEMNLTLKYSDIKQIEKTVDPNRDKRPMLELSEGEKAESNGGESQQDDSNDTGEKNQEKENK